METHRIEHVSQKPILTASYRKYWRAFDGSENVETRKITYADTGWAGELDHQIKLELQHDWNVYPKPYRVEVLRQGQPPYDLDLPKYLRSD